MNDSVFEGGFRRLPEQNLAGASKHSRKGDFLQKVYWERLNRQLEIKKLQCTIKMQALVRGYLVRQRLHHSYQSRLASRFMNGLEEKFTLDQLGKNLAMYFHLDTSENSNISNWLTNQVIQQHVEIIKHLSSPNSPWCWRIKWLLKVHIKRICFYCKQPAHDPCLSLSIQVLELFTNPSLFTCILGESLASAASVQIFLYIIHNKYFETLKYILEISEPKSLGFNDSSSLSAYVREFLLRPIKILALLDARYMSDVIRGLCQYFLTDKTTPEIRSIIMPMMLSLKQNDLVVFIDLVINGCVTPTTSCLYIIVELFKKGIFFSNPSIFCKTLEAFSVLLEASADYSYKSFQESYFCDEPIVDMEVLEEDEDDDDYSIIDCDEDSPLGEANAQMLKESINYLQSIDFAIELLNYIGTEYSMEVLTYFSSFLHTVITRQFYTKFKILWYAPLNPTIYRDLWTILYSMTRIMPDNKPISLLTLLCEGQFLNPDEAKIFYQILISFCVIFKRHICMRHTEDLAENSGLPLSLPKMTEISSKLRDVALAFLNIGMPDAPLTVCSHIQECNIKYMKDSYKVIVKLLRVLHSQELGSDQSFWESAKIPVSPVPLILSEHPLLSKHVPFEEETLKDRSIISSNNIAKTFVVLRDLPFIIATKDRMNILQELFIMFKTQFENLSHFMGENSFIKIRRDYIYEDAFEKLSPSEVPELRSKIRIQLTSAIGYEEEGVDGGGLFREFMNEFLRAAFDPNRGFFLLNKDRQLYPNPNVEVLYSNYKKHYFFIGRMLAKALYENILVDLPLADCFVSSLVKRDRDVNLSDLHSLDPVLYKNLILLRSYDGDFSNLGLNYTTVSDLYGHTTVTELIPGGETISVNKANKLDYIQTIAEYKLNTQIELQTSSFREGFASVFSIYWLAIFSAKELQRLIFCSDSPIDVQDLRNNCCYTGGYSSSHPNILRFWNVFQAFGDTERKQLIKFVTSCSRQPLLGFKDLDPPFTIQLVENSNRLPTSSTCMNLLKLPIFQDEQIMKDKLLYSIQAQAGFDLC